MRQPPPDQAPDGVETTPPKINPWELWTSLCLPSALTICFAILGMSVDSGLMLEQASYFGAVLVVFVGIVCWLSFSSVINKRYRGPSRVLLVLAYPIAQIALILGSLIAVAYAHHFLIENY